VHATAWPTFPLKKTCTHGNVAIVDELAWFANNSNAATNHNARMMALVAGNEWYGMCFFL
jgi:hypothetical protein